VGFTDELERIVKAELENHFIVLPDAHVPDNVPGLPLQIVGADKDVGTLGIAVTVTKVLADKPLQELIELIQAAKYVVFIVGLTVVRLLIVKAISEYHCIVEPEGHDPVKIAELPIQIDGEFKPVGAKGNGVTDTVVFDEELLQLIFELFLQAA
jgi:hypothetical protein